MQYASIEWLSGKYELLINIYMYMYCKQKFLANLMYFAILKQKKCVNLNLMKDSVCNDNMIVFLNLKHVFLLSKVN